MRPGLLYAGTEWGLYISFNDGANWENFRLNLPIVSIRDLHVREEYLIAATHGRSFWMIDDLGPVRQINEKILAKSNHLYEPKPAYRMVQSDQNGNSKIEGTNHPNGALLNFFVTDEKANVRIEILEIDGSLIRSYSNQSKESSSKLQVKTGGNKFIWNLRYPGFLAFPGMVLYSSPNLGPKAVPGTYLIQLIVDGDTTQQNLTVLGDPRMSNTPSDYQSQFDFLIQVRNKVSQAHQAMHDIEKIRQEIKYIESKIKDPELLAKITTFMDQLTIIEGTIHQTKNKSNQDPLNYGIKVNNRLAFLMADQQRGDYPPTDQAFQVFDELAADLDRILKEMTNLCNQNIPNLNRALNGLEAISMP